MRMGDPQRDGGGFLWYAEGHEPAEKVVRFIEKGSETGAWSLGRQVRHHSPTPRIGEGLEPLPCKLCHSGDSFLAHIAARQSRRHPGFAMPEFPGDSTSCTASTPTDVVEIPHAPVWLWRPIPL